MNQLRQRNLVCDELPEVYIYARRDDGSLNCTWEVTGYQVNWGCRGAVNPDIFEKWALFCGFVVGQVRNLESKLASKRAFAAATAAAISIIDDAAAAKAVEE